MVFVSTRTQRNSHTQLIIYLSFFAPNATAEILEEFLPKISVSSRSHLFVVESFLVFFLPTKIPPPFPSNGELPDNAPPFYWMPTIFSLWGMISGSLNDVLFFNLISRIAQDQVATPWNVGWTELQMQRVFKAGLSAMEVPVGSNPNGSGTMSGMGGQSDFAISTMGKYSPECFAIFIVWTMYPSSSSQSNTMQQHPGHLDSLGRLISLIRAVDNYYHPSNSGRWSKNLALFMESLGGEFLKRIRWEQQTECTIPLHLRITEEMKRQFVNVIKNIAFLSMFGKGNIF